MFRNWFVLQLSQKVLWVTAVVQQDGEPAHYAGPIR